MTENDADDKVEGLDADDDENTKITLISSGEKQLKFEMERSDAKMCRLGQNILDGDQEAKEIMVKQVEGPILKLIVEYLEHHKGKEPEEIAKPIRSVKMEKIVGDPWDATFINKQAKKTLFQLILGANYMDCKALLHLGCAKVATMIKGKSPEEIKQILGEESADKSK